MNLANMNLQLSDNPIYVYNDNGDRYDISNFPDLEYHDIKQLLGSDSLSRKGKAFERYMFGGVYVPRVTSILSYCRSDNDYLMKWAAKLGDNYNTEHENVLYTGSMVHELIEEYLLSKTSYIMSRVRKCKDEIITSYNNFLSWYNSIPLNISVYVSEMPLICPYYGGTLDAILTIGDKNYLVDFKTSRSISSEYFIQLSAYLWIINNYYPDIPKIDYIGVLRFDKKKQNCYQGVFLELNKPEDIQYIYQCQHTFFSALNVFYSMNVLQQETSYIIKNNRRNAYV